MVSSSLSIDNTDNAGGGGLIAPSSRFPYTEAFEKQFPYYLSIGMTEEQYWDRDSCLVTYYRKADEMRKERINETAWLQGMYIYDALARISPLFRAFGKKGTKPTPYVEEPYPISEEKAEEKQEKQQVNKGLAYMQAYMTKTNRHFEEKGVSNVNND